jgi:histidinol phosphatase-like enzyme
MLIYVDIDGTIAELSKNCNYNNSQPIQKNIDKINALYDEGNQIVYWTGRGQTTGIDWSDITLKQLKDWGCKFHELIMNKKPHFDLLIDDKAKRIEEI